ncbi:MAG: hypothetical protein DRJ64_09365, partial [Thermoprotei archaeon]
NIPLLFAQYVSSGNSVVIGTRFGGKKGRPHTHRPFNFAFLFFGMVAFSAAVGNNRGSEFFFVLITLAFFTFLPFRSRRFPLVIFLVAGMMIVSFSYGGNRGYLKAHHTLKEVFVRWAQAYYERHYQNFSKVTTALGDVGKMKLSGAIIMHLQSKKPPKLIKEAAFTTFGQTVWYHNDKHLTNIDAEKSGWVISEEEPNNLPPLHISYRFPRQQGVLPLPYNAALIRRLNVAGIERNSVGKFFVKEGPPLLDYDVVFADDETLGKPSRADLTIPKADYKVLSEIVDGFALPKKSSVFERVEAVERYLNTFSYSLTLSGAGDYETPLQNFLLHTKRGHCEFFATATVLLLRTQGVPARYAIGYAVSEKDEYSDDYIVRERDGHAWAEVYNGKAWKTVDTTPAVWFGEDAKNASIFENISDFIDFVVFSYQKYRLDKEEKSSLYMIAAILVLSLFLLIRISLRLRKNRVINKRSAADRLLLNSPLQKIVAHITKRGVVKQEQETVPEYLARAAKIISFEMPAQRLFYLHNKLLFDPEGISKIEKAELVSGVAGWIHRALRQEQ